jgi:hypothetical protein
MLKSELVQTDKHSTKISFRRKNLRFLRRTNHYTNTLQASAGRPQTERKADEIKNKNYVLNKGNL